MTLLRTKNYTILLLLLLGIGVPCIILGLLALRGLRNDQALREKEIKEKHQLLITSICADLDREMERMNTVFSEHKFGNYPDKPSDSLSAVYPIFEMVFFIDNRNNIRFPQTDLVYDDTFADGSTPSVIPADLLQGFRAEFKEADNSKAAGLYRLVNVSKDKQTMAQSLFALARLRCKEKDWQGALDILRQIRHRCFQTRLPSGLPAVPAAQLEEGRIEAVKGDEKTALICWLGLMKDLLGSRWRLNLNQFNFFCRSIKDEISSLHSLDAATQETLVSLENREKEARRKTERLITFRDVFPVLFDQSFFDELKGTHPGFSFQTGDQLFLVMLKRVSDSSSAKFSHIGCLLNQRLLAKELIPQLIEKRLGGSDTAWDIQDKNGIIVSSSESVPIGNNRISGGFTGDFPPWTLNLYQHNGSLFPLLFSQDRSLYGLVFLVIIIILIITIIWAVHTFLMTAELAETKTRFVAALSHDLKSPLTSIRQVSEMLRDGRVKPERRSSYFKLLARQSERLTFLMDNILDATSREIGKRRYYFEMISLDRLLEDFSTEFVPALEAEGFTLRLFIEKNLQKVRMDHAAVQQALTNLIDNARKFSSPGSNIDLKAGRAPGRQFISVRDYGPGIDAVTRKNIFRPFFRGTSATKAGIPGSGLGLSLVKSVMDSHKGTVRVESAPGEGSVFILEFPLRSKE